MCNLIRYLLLVPESFKIFEMFVYHIANLTEQIWSVPGTESLHELLVNFTFIYLSSYYCTEWFICAASLFATLDNIRIILPLFLPKEQKH